MKHALLCSSTIHGGGKRRAGGMDVIQDYALGILRAGSRCPFAARDKERRILNLTSVCQP